MNLQAAVDLQFGGPGSGRHKEALSQRGWNKFDSDKGKEYYRNKNHPLQYIVLHNDNFSHIHRLDEPKTKAVGQLHQLDPYLEKMDHKESRRVLKGGGPGSGRKPSYARGLNKWKSRDEELKKAAKDPKQMKLPLKAKEEDVELEGKPIRPIPGKKSIVKQGTQFCVTSDGVDKNFGCYPDKKQAIAVTQGKSFIEPLMEAGGPGSGCQGPNCGRHTVSGKPRKETPQVGKGRDFFVNGHRVAYSETKYQQGYGYQTGGDKSGGKTKTTFLKFDNEGLRKLFPEKASEIISHPGFQIIRHLSKPDESHVQTRLDAFKKLHGLDLEGFADMGEPMAGSMAHAHIDPKLWFHPPSLKNPDRVPTDDPKEKNNRFLDVTKRNSKDTKEQRMKLLKRSTPFPAAIPARTTLVEPHSAVYQPGMFSQAMRRKRRNGGMYRAFGAAKI